MGNKNGYDPSVTRGVQSFLHSGSVVYCLLLGEFT